MTDVVIYLGAPTRKTWGRGWQRAIKIEEADWHDIKGNYSAGETILDEVMDCKDRPADKCYVIRGTVEAIL